MNGYPSFAPRRFGGNNGGNMINMNGSQDGMDTMDMLGGQSLDDIVSQHDKVLRRRSMPMSYQNSAMSMDSPDPRRLSMMNFSDMNNGLENFQFNMTPGAHMDGIMPNATPFPTNGNPQNDRPGQDLALNTQYSDQNSPFTSMAGPASTYASPLHATASIDVGLNSPYDAAMSLPLDMNDPSLSMINNDMHMFSQNQFTSPIIDSPINQDFIGPLPQAPQDPSIAAIQSEGQPFGSASSTGTPDMRMGGPTRTGSREQISRGNSRSRSEVHSSRSTQNVPDTDPAGEALAEKTKQQLAAENQNSHQHPHQNTQHKFPWQVPQGGFPSTMAGARPHMETQFKNAYSSTGFDMLGVLMRVATRPNPEINIGSVDLSCAFVVCDATKDDNPIVYCSENFERLTGYNKHMILGRNCRFLQSPDGNVETGIRRKYVDDDSVLYLKNMINMRKEAQISLINYRRGGQPFMNLLTMIPISWETDDIKFFVGFQVDLVEQPASMTSKNPDGSYSVNYQRGLQMPRYVFNPEQHPPQPELGQTIPRDEVSNVLANYGASGDSEVTRRLWDKVLLENTDDVVHVLSLKGLFLYLSPSSRRILEYDASELVGTALSSVCHPSDIVPVTRELKETSSGASINVVFRIRRKHSGYMWFEGHGSLHTEQGKGRKCIILVGRERPVYTLSKAIVRASGGIGDNELWTKMSTSGMFLFVSANVRQLLDRQPDELVGTSIQALMRQDSKQEFGRILELSRTGRKADVKHEMINKRGQVLQAFTTIYPGDATEGQKPTFLVGQTRLLKYSRNAAQHAQRPSLYPKQEHQSGDSQGSQQSIVSGASSTRMGTASRRSSTTQQTSMSDSNFVTTANNAATYAGQHGLPLGHQDASLASEDNVFDELKTTRSSSWQYELRQMERRNRYLAEEVQSLLAAKKKRKRRKGTGTGPKDCANCHTQVTPEWRRGPSGNRDLCNSCGLRWAKQNGRVSPRTPSQHSQQSDKSKASASPRHNQTILPNTNEVGGQSSIPSTLAAGGKRSPQHQQQDSHAAKVARMEVAASQGFAGGIPEKIEEGVEPD